MPEPAVAVPLAPLGLIDAPHAGEGDGFVISTSVTTSSRPAGTVNTLSAVVPASTARVTDTTCSIVVPVGVAAASVDVVGVVGVVAGPWLVTVPVAPPVVGATPPVVGLTAVGVVDDDACAIIVPAGAVPLDGLAVSRPLAAATLAATSTSPTTIRFRA